MECYSRVSAVASRAETSSALLGDSMHLIFSRLAASKTLATGLRGLAPRGLARLEPYAVRTARAPPGNRRRACSSRLRTSAGPSSRANLRSSGSQQHTT